MRTRRWRPLAALSVAPAVAGVAVVTGVPSRNETPLGIGLALCGAAAMAAYLLLVRASDARYTTLAVVGRTYPIAALVLAGAAVVTILIAIALAIRAETPYHRLCRGNRSVGSAG